MADQQRDEHLVDELRAFVARSWSPELTLGEWWHRLAAEGWAFPPWPEGLGGRSLPRATARAVTAALAEAGVVGPPSGVGQTMGGPTVIAHGTEEQQRRLVPPVAAGAECWCQLFSEPGAGSDLASLQARAVREGAGWRVTGQKVWSSRADVSARGLLLARTHPDRPKHDGITYFILDMHQPAVQVLPLRQMSGAAEFCEVFIDGAWVSDDDVIGPVGGGWKVAFTTLGFERTGTAEGGPRGLVRPGAGGGRHGLDRTVGDILATRAARRGPPRPSGYVLSPRLLIEQARRLGRSDDPIVRQRLARFHTLVEVNRLTTRRSREATARRAGSGPGPESSVGKLAISEIARESRDLGFWLFGADGMLAGAPAPLEGAVGHVALSSFAAGLGGGTDETQRTTIGERVLGLPKEPQVDAGVPFSELVVGHRRPPGGKG